MSEPWFRTSKRLANPRLRVLCFPYAGGGASLFRGWEPALGDGVEVCAAQLPGREWRRREACHVRVASAVDELVDALPAGWLDGPYVLFGYSLGAVLAFELARRLRSLGRPLPSRLVVAACKPPHVVRRFGGIYELSDEGFLSAVRRLGGMPDAILAEPELLDLVLPMMRADFEMLGTYVYRDEPPLPIPLIAYGGTRDMHATRAELAAWRRHTAEDYSLRLFDGGHFFLNEVRERLLSTLARDLPPPADLRLAI